MDNERYTTYKCKDERERVYDKVTHKVTSYPRILMEEKLGKPLLPNEDVHHKDEDPTNNDPDNLEVIEHGPHQRQYNEEKIANGEWKNETSFQDKEMTCPVCGSVFIWSAKQQYAHHKNRTRKNDHPIEGPLRPVLFYEM